MDNTIFIDAKYKLKPQSIEKFKSTLTDDTIITMYIEAIDFIAEKPLSEFRQFFEDESIEAIIPSNDCVISFIAGSSILSIAGIDYKWWIEPVRGKKYARLNKLFNNVDSKPEKSSDIHKCIVGKIYNGNEVKIIDSFEGKMKDLLAFVNKQRQIDLLKTFFKSDLVYLFDYEQFDSFDASKYKTYEQLVEEGVFVL